MVDAASFCPADYCGTANNVWLNLFSPEVAGSVVTTGAVGAYTPCIVSFYFTSI